MQEQERAHDLEPQTEDGDLKMRKREWGDMSLEERQRAWQEKT